MDGSSAAADRLRVLILLMYPYPDASPSGNHMQRLARGLRALGHEVLVLAPQRAGRPVPTEGRDEFGTPYMTFEIPAKPRRIPNYLHLLCRVRPGMRDLLARTLQKGKWDAAVHSGESWWVHDPLRRLCQANGVKALPLPIEWFGPTLAGILGLSWFDQWLHRRITYRKADGLVGIARIWSDLAARYGIPSIVLPSLSKFDDDELPSINQQSNSRFRIVYVGKWVRRELPCTLMRGMELALERGVDLELVVLGFASVGTSPAQKLEERPALRFLKRTPKVRERVRLMGWLPDEAFSRELAAADAFVLLRADNRETRALFPTRLPEFLATGKPLIVSDAGDLAHYLKHLESAYVIPPGDQPAALAEAFAFLASHAEQARRIGQGGQAVLREAFSQRKLAQRLADFIYRLEAVSNASPRHQSVVTTP